MNLLSYFKSVVTIAPDEVREMIKGKQPGEYCLLDVRLPKEYEKGHIPGAVLIPVGQLPDRLAELDRKTPIITYCAIGGRSRSAASILQDAGFEAVYNMKGGYNAWSGLTVKGPPDIDMAYFEKVERPEDILLLAWALEEGSRRFYEAMGEIAADKKARNIYRGLTEAEKIHQETVTNLYHEVTSTTDDYLMPFYAKFLSEDEMEQLMEGQMKLGQVLAWARDRDTKHVLEFSIGLEAKLYDLYFRMKKKHTEPRLHRIYATLADEEKRHIDLFTELLESMT